MEPRKITVIETKNQRKSVIISRASTLGELKEDFRNNNIDYSNMSFFEGVSKVELKTDSSILPHDVPYKGTTTNELVFMLTNTNKKIKSGAMSRKDILAAIKLRNLQDYCQKTFGKNYTQCKSVDLETVLQNNKSEKTPNNTKEENISVESNKENVKSKENNFDAFKSMAALLNILMDGNVISHLEAKCVLQGKNFYKENDQNGIESSYTEDDIEDMFSDMI